MQATDQNTQAIKLLMYECTAPRPQWLGYCQHYPRNHLDKHD